MSRPLPERVHAFLQEARFASLATINRDGTPQQSAIWYDLDGDVIIMNTRQGRLKDRNMRRDPRVSFCVVDGYRYVTVRGSVMLIDDQDIAQVDIRRLATRYDGPESAEEQMRTQFSKEHRVTVRLPIGRVSVYGLSG